jgi:hypothetical protein
MNTSLFTADRDTHIKIVVVALVAAIAVATVAINARLPDSGSVTAHGRSDSLVVRAGEPARYSVRDEAAIR